VKFKLEIWVETCFAALMDDDPLQQVKVMLLLPALSEEGAGVDQIPKGRKETTIRRMIQILLTVSLSFYVSSNPFMCHRTSLVLS
jgi:hypothetical protein